MKCLGEDCGIYKTNTTYHTTVDCFLGSQSIMHLVEILKVLEFDPMLADVHCGVTRKILIYMSKQKNYCKIRYPCSFGMCETRKMGH